MTDYLRVKGWSEHQAYKDGRPVHWIKFHLAILDDYDLDTLPENTQLHLFKIWLLAGKTDNKIPNDARWVARRIGAQTGVDLKALIDLGFLCSYETVRDRTDTNKNPYSNALVEERREDKKKKGASCKRKHFVYPSEFESLWQTYPKRNGSNPKNRAYSAYRARLKEGVPHADIAAGVERYAAWCESTGKVGTETVMQTQRFFGTGEEWKNEWAASVHLNLPRDPKALFAIRRAIGLPFEFDEVKSCHAEIQGAVRADPAKRQAVEALL